MPQAIEPPEDLSGPAVTGVGILAFLRRDEGLPPDPEGPPDGGAPWALIQGHFVPLDPPAHPALVLAGVPAAHPPAVHQCCQAHGAARPAFYDLRLDAGAHGAWAVPAAQLTGGDWAALSTTWADGLVPSGADQAASKVGLSFVPEDIKTGPEIPATLAKYFGSLERKLAAANATHLVVDLICIGQMTVTGLLPTEE